jgi:hypothetical protein
MNPAFREWLGRLEAAGVLACGLGFPDRTSLSRSFSPGFPEAALAKIWIQVAETYEIAHLHRFTPLQLRWLFENAQLNCYRRPDRIFLGMFLSNDPRAVDVAAVEALFAEFKTLPAR